jgi:outer membrane murein-binding lipoprotein Lpp
VLDTYRKLEAFGVIGRMMKVGQDGQPIIDPSGEKPGTLVQRPFAEYPKAVRRVRTDPITGEEKIITLVAGSKAEELKIMSDTADLATPLSPLERERNQLAEDLATQQKMNGNLATQLENALARIEQLAAGQAKLAEQIKPPEGTGPKAEAPADAKPAVAISSAEAKALANKK